MGIISDLFKAIKGGANEVGEAIVDTQAIRIYEQDIREAEDAIRKAKGSLTRLKSSEIALARKVRVIEDDIADYEQKAVSALDAANEALAIEIAERISSLEEELAPLNEELASLKRDVLGINKTIKNREKTIAKNKRELDKVKTVDLVQKTTKSISNNLAATNSTTNSVKRSLDRIKAKQQRHTDEMAAGEWLEEENSADDLDKKIKAAGLGGQSAGSSDVLARLKAKSKAK